MQTSIFRPVMMGTALLAAGALSLVSCKKEDEVGALTVSTATVGGRDIAGATAATGVGLTSNVVVRFNKALNASTATANSVTLTPTGGSAVAATVTAAGDSIVVNPTNDLLSGTRYTLTLSNALKANDGGSFTARNFTFTTFGPLNVTPPKVGNQIAFWAFDGTVNESQGRLNISGQEAITFGADRKNNAGAAAMFDGDRSIIEVANGTSLITPSNSLAFWIKLDTNQTHGHFVMGANFFRGHQFEFTRNGEWFKSAANFNFAASADSNTGEDLFYNANGQYNTTGGWMGHTFKDTRNLKQEVPDKWVHVVHTYDATTKIRTMYLNGQRVMASDFNLWPVGDSKRRVIGMRTQTANDLSTTWAFGFGKGRDASFWSDTDFGDYNKPGANHFKGALDNVRFWNTAITADDVTTLYNAER